MARKFKLPGSWIMLIGAVVFGGLAVFSASRYISQTVQREKDRLNPNVESIDVVVAKENMQRGDVVSTDNMAVRKIPKDFVPGTAVTPDTFGNVEGARLAVDIRRGEVLIRGTLEGADVSTFSTRIEKGVRAITLPVDEVNSLSGLLQPNDRVDIFFTAKPIQRAKPAAALVPEQTQLLLQNVIILATGRQVRPTIAAGSQSGVGRAFTTITIEASPANIQRLILAQKTGSLTAVLRSNADALPITAAAMDARDLFASGAPISGRRAGETTEIIIGGKGGVHGERELLRMLGFDRPPPNAVSSDEPASSGYGVAALKDLLKSAAPPSEAATMSR